MSNKLNTKQASEPLHNKPPRSRRWLGRIAASLAVIATLAPGLEMAREEADYHLFGHETAVKAAVDRVKTDSQVMQNLANDATHSLPLRYSQLPVTTSQLRQVRSGRTTAQKLVPPLVESSPNLTVTNFSSTLGREAVVDAITQTAEDTTRHSLTGSALQKDYRHHLADNVSSTAAEEEAIIQVDLAAMNKAISHRSDDLPVMRKFGEFQDDNPELGVIYGPRPGSFIPADWSGPVGMPEITKVYPLTFNAAIKDERMPGLKPIK